MCYVHKYLLNKMFSILNEVQCVAKPKCIFMTVRELTQNFVLTTFTHAF